MKWVIAAFVAIGFGAAGLGAASTASAAEEDEMSDRLELVEFSRKEEVLRWQSVDDRVMGGISRSRMMLDATENTALFTGTLSLENNGGFASVRREVSGLGDAVAVLLRVKGDGRKYQFRVRTDERLAGVSYRASFETQADEWIEVELPAADFRPQYRGRAVNGMPPLDLAQARQIAFLIGDKRPGEFQLEVEWIGLRTATESGWE